jgi:hypothetical protein
MATRVEHMMALKGAWERAPAGPLKVAALRDYEAAQKENLARSEKDAADYLNKAVDALK